MEDDVRQSGADRYAVSQAYRWKAERDKAMQELRQLKDSSRDTTMSAYDLLPEEERDAVAWVREHGGLDSVKKLLDWVVGHCSTRQQLDFDFWLSGRVMHELGFDEDMADRGEVERRLLARLMPDGYEWPRYESGEPLRYEDRYVYDGREREVWHVDFDSYGEPTILNKDGTRCHPDKGERVVRSAPKVLDADEVPIKEGDTVYYVDVLDADGVEIRVGDTVYQMGCKYRVSHLHGANDYVRIVYENSGRWVDPKTLTHRAPVLAADGKPLEAGQTVWDVESGTEYEVVGIHTDEDTPVRVMRTDGSHLAKAAKPDTLTHERPVIDADGVETRVWDTVYEIETGERYFVTNVFNGMTEPDFPEHTVECRKYEDVVTHMFRPSQLTHTRPEPPDSWERIEKDAGCTATKYNERRGTIFTTKQQVARDLVRRCRALAERGE